MIALFPPAPLAELLATKQQQVAQQQAITPLAGLRALAQMQARPKDLSSTLKENRPALVGQLVPPPVHDPGSDGASYDPVALARRLVRRDARAVIVPTDARYHHGAVEHLTLVANAVDVPVIRFDYIVDEYQVVETRAAGADALILYAAGLAPDALRRLISATQRNLMTAVVLVQSAGDVGVVLPFEPRVVALCNYDAASGAFDFAAAAALRALLPGHIAALAAGGLDAPDAVKTALDGPRPLDGIVVDAGTLIGERGTAIREAVGLDVSKTATGDHPPMR